MTDEHHKLPPDLEPPGRANPATPYHPYQPPQGGVPYSDPAHPPGQYPPGLYPPPPDPRPKLPFPGVAWFFLLTLIGLVGQLVVGVIGTVAIMAGTGVEPKAMESYRLEGTAFTLFTAMLFAATWTWPATVLIAARVTRLWNRAAFHFHRARLWPIILAVLCGLALVPLALLLEALCAKVIPRSDNPVVKLMAQPHSALATGFMFATIVVGAPLGEELFFRGFCFRGMVARHGATTAGALVSVVFAAIHLNATGFAALFGVSGVLCYITWRSASLFPAIALHATYNGVQFAMLVAITITPQEAAEQTKDTSLGPLVWMAPVGLLVLLLCLILITQITPDPGAHEPPPEHPRY